MVKGKALVLMAAMLAAPAAASAAPAIPMPPPGSVSPKGPNKAETYGRWTLLHVPDSMTDDLLYVAGLSPQEGEGATLALTCRPSSGFFAVAYNADNLVALTKDQATLTYRFDNEPPTSASAVFEGEDLVLHREASQTLAAGLESHSRLRTRITDSAGNTEDRTFDLAGAKAVVARMRTLCAGGR